MHPAPEPRIEVPLEQIWRLHDVHVTVDEPEPILHDTLLAWLSTPRASLPCTPRPSGILLGRRLRRYARCRASSAGFARAIPPSGEVRKGGKAPSELNLAPARSSLHWDRSSRPLPGRSPLRASSSARRCRCAPRHRRFPREPGTIWSTRGEPCRWRSPLPRAPPPARSRRADDPDAYRASVIQHDVPKRSAYLTLRGPKAGARTSFGTRGAIHGGIPWWCSTARATSSAPGARASSIAPTASTWPPTTRSGSPTMATTPCATARWTAASFSPLASRGSPRPT